MKAAFFTLGCKVNQYESQVLSQLFSAEGFDIVDPNDEADVYVINSCTVTASGDKKTRQMLRRFKRQNPAAVVALTGCFPQAFPDAAEKLPEADVITGAYRRADLLVGVRQALAGAGRFVQIVPHEKGEAFERMRASSFEGRTRAFLKIEDGCERYCSYCIIPTARGPVRSKLPEDITSELTELAASGHKEAVLVGINLSCYGKELGLRLIDAIQIACRVDGIQRVRLGSLEPELLTPEDIAKMASEEKMCPQFHLSLQSGCDATLKRMNRHYTTQEYMEIVNNLRQSFGNAAITTDVMVGFPGETEEEFLQSLEFVRKVGFAKVHVFAYSRRAGTRADKMPDQVPQEVKEQRSHKMIQACEETRQAFLKNQIGLTESVLFETVDEQGIYTGYTKNYTPVYLYSIENLCGTIQNVVITGLERDGCSCLLAKG